MEESAEHQHTADCYETSRELVCGLSEQGHQHTDACYEQIRTLTCTRSEEAEEPKLICNRPEITLHEHTASCYDPWGVRICGMQEVLEHVHSESCFQPAEEELTCGLEESAEHQLSLIHI